MAERDLGFELPTRKATTIFRSAADFGLTANEILELVAETLERMPSPARADCLDDLAQGFAARVLEKQRARPRP